MTDETASANEIAADASADNTAAAIDFAVYSLATRTFDITAPSPPGARQIAAEGPCSPVSRPANS